MYEGSLTTFLHESRLATGATYQVVAAVLLEILQVVVVAGGVHEGGNRKDRAASTERATKATATSARKSASKARSAASAAAEQVG